jgi:hypothetical protein
MGIIPTMTAMTVEKQATIRTWCDRQLEIHSPAACLRAPYQQIKIVTTINKHPNQQEYQTVKRLKTDYSILYLQSHRENWRLVAVCLLVRRGILYDTASGMSQ